MHSNSYHTNDTKKLANSLGPYSPAVDTGYIVFISGQIPIIPDTQIIPDNIYEQTYQALNNIKNIVEEKKLSINNIVKTTLFITNIHDLPIINNSYINFFHQNNNINKNTLHFPARSCVEVSRLPKNVKIEIEAIAIRFKT